MPKPVCIPCQRFFRPLRNGVDVLESMPRQDKAPPGIAAPELWEPYKVWHADSWMCPGCGTTIVVGFGLAPLWERHDQRPQPECSIIVNDC
jgi:hypothetical protein